jgi:hypothetical protein
MKAILDPGNEWFNGLRIEFPAQVFTPARRIGAKYTSHTRQSFSI